MVVVAIDRRVLHAEVASAYFASLAASPFPPLAVFILWLRYPHYAVAPRVELRMFGACEMICFVQGRMSVGVKRVVAEKDAAPSTKPFSRTSADSQSFNFET